MPGKEAEPYCGFEKCFTSLQAENSHSRRCTYHLLYYGHWELAVKVFPRRFDSTGAFLEHLFKFLNNDYVEKKKNGEKIYS